VPDIDDNLFQRAKDGDKSAIFIALDRYGVDPAIIKSIAGWHRGRERDHAVFANLVAARKHYVQRGWDQISKAARIAELIEQFSLSPNIAKHIANAQGYEAVREEAQRQIEAEANYSKVGFPTA
jgi:hypothetical protein